MKDLNSAFEKEGFEYSIKKLKSVNLWEKEGWILLRMVIAELILGIIITGGIMFFVASNNGWFVGLGDSFIILVLYYAFFILSIIILIVIVPFAFFSFFYAIIFKFVYYRSVKDLKERNQYFSLINIINEGRIRRNNLPRSRVSFTIPFPFNFIYNDERCILAALSEINEKNVEEALLTFIRHKPKIHSFALKALGVLAVKNGFDYLDEYIAYLDKRRNEALRKLNSKAENSW